MKIFSSLMQNTSLAVFKNKFITPYKEKIKSFWGVSYMQQAYDF